MRESPTAQSSLFDLYSPHKFGAFLGELSRVLDDHPEILPLLDKDFRTVGTQSTGRKGLSVESTFRCMLLKQITGVSYEMLAFHLADSSSYRAYAYAPCQTCQRPPLSLRQPRRFEALIQLLPHQSGGFIIRKRRDGRPF